MLSRNPRKSETLNRVTLEAGIRSDADLRSNYRANPLIPSPKIQIKGKQSVTLVIQTQKASVKTLDQGSKKRNRNGRVKKKRKKRKKKLSREQASDDCGIEKKQEKSSTKEKNKGGESDGTKQQSRSKEETAKGLRSNRKPGKIRRKRRRSEIFTEGFPASQIKALCSDHKNETKSKKIEPIDAAENENRKNFNSINTIEQLEERMKQSKGKEEHLGVFFDVCASLLLCSRYSGLTRIHICRKGMALFFLPELRTHKNRVDYDLQNSFSSYLTKCSFVETHTSGKWIRDTQRYFALCVWGLYSAETFVLLLSSKPSTSTKLQLKPHCLQVFTAFTKIIEPYETKTVERKLQFSTPSPWIFYVLDLWFACAFENKRTWTKRIESSAHTIRFGIEKTEIIHVEDEYSMYATRLRNSKDEMCSVSLRSCTVGSSESMSISTYCRSPLNLRLAMESLDSGSTTHLISPFPQATCFIPEFEFLNISSPLHSSVSSCVNPESEFDFDDNDYLFGIRIFEKCKLISLGFDLILEVFYLSYNSMHQICLYLLTPFDKGKNVYQKNNSEPMAFKPETKYAKDLKPKGNKNFESTNYETSLASNQSVDPSGTQTKATRDEDRAEAKTTHLSILRGWSGISRICNMEKSDKNFPLSMMIVKPMYLWMNYSFVVYYFRYCIWNNSEKVHVADKLFTS